MYSTVWRASHLSCDAYMGRKCAHFGNCAKMVENVLQFVVLIILYFLLLQNFRHVFPPDDVFQLSLPWYSVLLSVGVFTLF